MQVWLRMTYSQLLLLGKPFGTFLFLGGVGSVSSFGFGTLVPFVAFCSAWVLLGALMHGDWVRLEVECPNCRRDGEVSFRFARSLYKMRTWFDCPYCGRLLNRSFFFLRLDHAAGTLCPTCNTEYLEPQAHCSRCDKVERTVPVSAQ